MRDINCECTPGQNNEIHYNDYGQLHTKMNFIFGYYEKNGLLKSIFDTKSNKTMNTFIYKDEKLIFQLKPHEIIQYYYYQEKIIATHSNITGYTKLYYDINNHIFAMKTNHTIYYIATDLNGTPISIFNVENIEMKKIQRTAFGFILEDTNPNFIVPIGYFSGIEIPESGIVILGNKPYDSHIGQWMTPQLEFIKNPKNLTNIFQIHSYRFKNNDPFSQDINYMDTYEDWLRIHLIKPPQDYFKRPSVFTQIGKYCQLSNFS